MTYSKATLLSRALLNPSAHFTNGGAPPGVNDSSTTLRVERLVETDRADALQARRWVSHNMLATLTNILARKTGFPSERTCDSLPSRIHEPTGAKTFQKILALQSPLSVLDTWKMNPQNEQGIDIGIGIIW